MPNTRRILSAASLLAALTLASTTPLSATSRAGPEPIIGGPCEGCEAVFQGLPDDLSWRARIAPQNEPGEPMIIEGTVHDAQGEAAPGVIVYAYHTDAEGIYPPEERFPGTAAYRHGRLRAWAETDDRGRYRFDTIRPARYPSNDIPAHVHMHIIEPGCCTYYLTSIHFGDDPLLSDEQRTDLADGRGGNALVEPARDTDGVWRIHRDITLGAGVPDYPRRD